MSASNAVRAQILARSAQLQKATANTLSIPINASIAEHVKTVAPSAQFLNNNRNLEEDMKKKHSTRVLFLFNQCKVCV